MEENKQHLDELLTHAGEYLRAREELTRHVVTEKTVVLSSSFISTIVILGVIVVALVFFGIAAALLIGDYVHSVKLGFFIVGVVMLVLLLILVWKREYILERPVMNKMIKTIYKEHNHGNNSEH